MTKNTLRSPSGPALAILAVALLITGWASWGTTWGLAETTGEPPTALQVAYKTGPVLDRAVEVYGGQEFLDGINDVDIVITGTTLSTGRSWNSEQGRRAMDIITEVAFQKKEGHYRYGGKYDDRDFSNMITSANSYWANTFNDEETHLLFPLLKMATRGFGLPGIQDAAEALVPHLVVAELVKARRKVIWIGEEEFEGRIYDLIAYPEGIVGNTVFAFDRETGVLAALQSATSGGASGDLVRQLRLGGYYEQGETLYPKTRTSYSGDKMTAEYVYETLNLNADLDISRFGPPEDYQVFDNLPNRDSEVITLADNVYWTPLGSATLFVEFDDYVIVMNTLGGEHLSLVRDTVGDKPVRFAVTMDHHGQQTSGLRAFVSEGIPIITTSGNRAYLEALATTHSALNPDALALDPKDPVFEIVDDRRVFDDGTTRLEIINIGPTKHAEDLYVGYLPNEKIVFAADFFNFNPGALPIAIPAEYMPLAQDSYDALKRAGIEAETLVLAHGWGWRTIKIADIERILSGQKGS